MAHKLTAVMDRINRGYRTAPLFQLCEQHLTSQPHQSAARVSHQAASISVFSAAGAAETVAHQVAVSAATTTGQFGAAR